jgi:hypothetical protein
MLPKVSIAIPHPLDNSFVKGRHGYGWWTPELKSDTSETCKDNNYSKWNIKEDLAAGYHKYLNDISFFSLDNNDNYTMSGYELDSLLNVPHQFLCKSRASMQISNGKWTCTEKYESEKLDDRNNVSLDVIT